MLAGAAQVITGTTLVIAKIWVAEPIMLVPMILAVTE
jgi:hypothetical protein